MFKKARKGHNFTAIDNRVKRIFLADDNALDYGDLAVYTYIAMFIQVGDKGADGRPNGKQSYCYKTKVAMRGELRMSRDKLDKHLRNLKRYGFIDSREVPNKYGGRPVEEYRLIDDWQAYL